MQRRLRGGANVSSWSNQQLLSFYNKHTLINDSLSLIGENGGGDGVDICGAAWQAGFRLGCLDDD